MLSLQPLELFLLGRRVLICELTLERLECGFGLPAGGFDQADSFEQLRAGDTGVSELRLEVLVVLLQLLELSPRWRRVVRAARVRPRWAVGEIGAAPDLLVLQPIELLLAAGRRLLGTAS